MTTDYTGPTCPMPDCGEDLFLDWELNAPIYNHDLTDGAAPISHDHAITAYWKVSCGSGHVILLPGPPGCPVHEEDCPDDSTCDEYDSYELRTFRPHDIGRLRDVLTKLRAAVTT